LIQGVVGSEKLGAADGVDRRFRGDFVSLSFRKALERIENASIRKVKVRGLDPAKFRQGVFIYMSHIERGLVISHIDRGAGIGFDLVAFFDQVSFLGLSPFLGIGAEDSDISRDVGNRRLVIGQA
jgi:hypothetical protein